MRAGLICALVFAGLAPGEAGASEPSFDCAQTTSSAEEAVCADPELARLDRRVAARFEQAVAALKKTAGWKGATAELRAIQRGWIKGRDECWKADDLTACIRDAYERREGELVALYLLEGPRSVTFWSCNANPADEVVVYAFDLPRPAVRLERGDTVDTGLQVPAASGARYAASFGREIWIKGEQAMLTWPEGQTQNCGLKN